MAIKEKLNSDLKEAMKAKDSLRTSVLRMLLSEMKYAQASVNIHQELGDDEAAKVIGTYHKRLTKSLDDYPQGEKRDVILKEILIVEDYLPKKASEAEVLAVVQTVLSEHPTAAFGVLMKEVMARLGSGADGKLVSTKLKEKLEQKT